MAAGNITLSFGLMTLVLTKDTAVEKPTAMSNLCTGQDGVMHDPSPLRASKTCDHCGPIVSYDNVVKGVKEGPTWRIVKAEDVQEAKAEFTAGYLKKIGLVPHPAGEFLRATQPGPSIYYLTPTTGGDAADQYQLLVKLIAEHPELAFVGLHTPRSVTGLYMVTVRDGVLVMQERVREQAIKPAPSVGGEPKPLLYGMLDGLLDQMVVDYDPEAYEDRYALALDQMIAKADTVQVESDTKTATPVAMSNDELMLKLAALRKVA